VGCAIFVEVIPPGSNVCGKPAFLPADVENRLRPTPISIAQEDTPPSSGRGAQGNTLRSTRMTYYVWHDEGCCDNSRDDLAQAREIKQQLLADGHSDAYITDSDHNVVDEDYIECSYCERRAVALLPQSSDQGKTISMVHCCGAHRVGWWDGADWDGRTLEVELHDSHSDLRETSMSDQIFSGIYPCGIVYADRHREKGGDYARLAFLPYDSLELKVEADCPPELRKQIESDAATIQARRGELFQISSAGQTVMLGCK